MRTNIKKLVFVTVGLLAFTKIGFCQGFINLDFESARIIPIVGGPNYPYDIATSNAVPAWTVLIGGNPISQITYNDPALGSTFVTLWATNGAQISGNYSVLLQGGLTASSASISQTGLVPVSAQSLLFYGAGNSPTTPVIEVSLGGQNLPLMVISNALNYTVYGADISAFAGQIKALTFSALEASNGYNDWNIDNIQFSSTPVPEPSGLVLAALGSLFLGFRRWRNSSR